MELSKPFHRKKIVVIFLACILIFSGLSARVVYLMVVRAAHYSELALDLHQRERKIKAKRGRILDRNGIVLADNQPVCTISVIHNQIRDSNAVIALLCSKLGLSEETVRKRVEKVSSIEKIKSNVDLETGEEIYRTGLDGIKVDEDYKRYYPYENLASKVIGFTGGDNQGILALESRYEEVLSGQEGLILEMTDARRWMEKMYTLVWMPTSSCMHSSWRSRSAWKKKRKAFRFWCCVPITEKSLRWRMCRNIS